MKIFALTIVILALNGYVTKATSLDPLENVEIDDTRNDRDDSRTKRSGNLFSSLLKKKFGLLGSLSGTSSGKSIGHSEHFPDHFEEPLSYHTKSFNLWGVKKAIMSSVFQAAKAITGGVIALKGQLIKAKGHAVVAKGKLLQTKGEAISNFGKTIATHAFDVHHEPHLDVQSGGGLYNHLPVAPIHQPTSYGAASAFGYQGQAYPSNVFQGNAYQNSVGYPSSGGYQVAPSYQTGFGVPQSGYGGGTSFGGYGGNSFTAKRAAVQNSQESSVNQVQSAFDKDSVQAGLLIFKPIKMPAQNVPTNGNSAAATQTTSSSQQQIISQRPSQQLGPGAFNPTDFKTTQQSFGFQKPFTSGFQADVQSGRYSQYSGPNSYQVPDLGYQSPNLGYRAPDQSYPPNGGSSEQMAGPQTFDFQQPANSQEFGQDFGQQLAAFSAGQQQQQLPAFPVQQQQVATFPVQQQQLATFPVQQQQLATFPVQQQQPASFSQESYEDDLSSGVDERVAQPSYKRTHLAAKRGSAPASERLVAVAPSTTQVAAATGYGGDVAKTQKRSAPLPPSRDDVIVPLKYHDDSTAEDQARLKQTVQRFFSMLQKQRYEKQKSLNYLLNISNKTLHSIKMKKTQSSQSSNGEKKSNYKLVTYLTRPKTSKRKIDNNIKEKLFQAKVHTYNAKQKRLLDNIKELIKVYQQCIKMSKHASLPKSKYFEDIELVVARIVDEAFGMRVGNDETVGRQDADQSTTAGVSEIRVWDRRSPDDRVLTTIAGKLLAAHGRLRVEMTDRLSADRDRLRQLIEQPAVTSAGHPVNDLARALDGDRTEGAVPAAVVRKRDLVEIMTRVRDALSANRGHRPSTVAGSSCSGGWRYGVNEAHEVHEVRKRLALVTDTLRATEKDKSDLLEALARSRSDPTTTESLRAILVKEREKNDHLQSVVDDMFTAINAKNNA